MKRLIYTSLSIALLPLCLGAECGGHQEVCSHLGEPAWTANKEYFSPHCPAGNSCYIGKPKLSLASGYGTNFVEAQSIFQQNYQTSGLAYPLGNRLDDLNYGTGVTASVLVNPQGELDSPGSLSVSDESNIQRKLFFNIYAGDYGKTRRAECGTLLRDQATSVRSDPGVWQWNNWYLLWMIVTDTGVTCLLYLSDENGKTSGSPLWKGSTTLQTPFRIGAVGFSQSVGTPGAGTWRVNSRVGDICIGGTASP